MTTESKTTESIDYEKSKAQNVDENGKVRWEPYDRQKASKEEWEEEWIERNDWFEPVELKPGNYCKDITKVNKRTLEKPATTTLGLDDTDYKKSYKREYRYDIFETRGDFHYRLSKLNNDTVTDSEYEKIVKGGLMTENRNYNKMKRNLAYKDAERMCMGLRLTEAQTQQVLALFTANEFDRQKFGKHLELASFCAAAHVLKWEYERNEERKSERKLNKFDFDRISRYYSPKKSKKNYWQNDYWFLRMERELIEDFDDITHDDIKTTYNNFSQMYNRRWNVGFEWFQKNTAKHPDRSDINEYPEEATARWKCDADGNMVVIEYEVPRLGSV